MNYCRESDTTQRYDFLCHVYFVGVPRFIFTGVYKRSSSFRGSSSSVDITMHALSSLLFLGLAVAAWALPSRIVGGHDAAIGAYPYIASLRLGGRHFCGGSIVSKRYILTAAHCLEGMLFEYIQVSVGTNFVNETGTVYQAKVVTPHEHFDGYLLNNDIGLIRVDRDIEYTDKVQPIPVDQDDKFEVGHDCQLAGWGRLRFHGIAPVALQEIDLLIHSQEHCKQVHWRVSKTHICTYTKHGQGACHGDSGGPLAADGIQIGIVSFGDPCGVGSPDVFTRVASYKDWLAKNMVE